MKTERITAHEIDAAIRQHGETDQTKIAAVIFESNGTLRVLSGNHSGLDQLN